MRTYSQDAAAGTGMAGGVAGREPDRVPGDARERSIWVQAKLRLHATSFAQIARRLGVTGRAVGQAMYAPNHRVETAIAQAIGLEPTRLFAERYAQDGTRLHSIRAPRGTDGGAPGGGAKGGDDSEGKREGGDAAGVKGMAGAAGSVGAGGGN